MLAGITGTRSGPGGSRVDWPAVGEILECADAEAADLIASELALTEPDYAAHQRRRAAEHANRRAFHQSRSWR